MEAVLDTTEVRVWKRYPEYRPIETAWLDELPADWEFKRLKWTIEDCQNGVWGEDPKGHEEEAIGCVRVADFDRANLDVSDDVELTKRFIQKSHRDGRGLKRGDLLLEKSGGGDLQPVGAVVVYDSDVEAVCSNFVARVAVADGYSSSYLRYLHAALYRARVNTRSMKQATGIQNLDSDQYFDEKAGLPPLREQRAIAAFLDRETARIDTLIGHKQRLIDLLEEKRQAVISHAVTKGLDPNVEMKDSGLPWIEQIPSTWEVLPLRRVVSQFVDYRGKTPEKCDSGIPLVTATAVRNGRIDHSRSPDYVTQETYDKWMVRGFPEIGDVVFTTEGATFGETGQIVDASVALAQRLILFKVDPSRMTNDFLFYHFISDVGKAEHHRFLVGTTVYGIRSEQLKDTRVLIPPIEEQKEISGFVRQKLGSIESFSDKISESIVVLQEYRSALISAAVTGQIDVREEVELDG